MEKISTARYFIFSVDTEPDAARWAGHSPENATCENFAALEELGGLLEKYAVRATFYVSYSAARNPKVQSVLSGLATGPGCEVGTHFHPGETPPYTADRTDNVLALEDEILESKFISLHSQVHDLFGAPRTFRAGAWTIDKRLIGLLARHAYTSDSSVTPGICWNLIGRPDYRRCSFEPYRLREHPQVMEVPVTIRSGGLFTHAEAHIGSLFTMPLASRVGPHWSLFRRATPFRPLWLRPATSTTGQMNRIFKTAMEQTGVAHAMVHSNEFAVGTSPYSRTPRQLGEIRKKTEELFGFASECGCTPVTVSEFVDAVGKVQVSSAAE